MYSHGREGIQSLTYREINKDLNDLNSELSQKRNIEGNEDILDILKDIFRGTIIIITIYVVVQYNYRSNAYYIILKLKILVEEGIHNF